VNSIPAGQLLDLVLLAIAQIRPGRTPQSEDTFTALGLDSLDRLTLAVSVERSAGLPISDQILSAAVSPADLTRRLLAVPIGAIP
jgi:acyl carrier protein